MAINPIASARAVNEQFLRYQLTAFPLADEAVSRQADEGIRSPAKAFRVGPRIRDLVTQEVLHPAFPGIVEYPDLVAHQDPGSSIREPAEGDEGHGA